MRMPDKLLRLVACVFMSVRCPSIHMCMCFSMRSDKILISRKIQPLVSTAFKPLLLRSKVTDIGSRVKGQSSLSTLYRCKCYTSWYHLGSLFPPPSKHHSGRVWSDSKGLLTFLGSLYKEVAKPTPGTLVYLFERQTARILFSSFQKHCVLNLECKILSQEPSDSFILYFNVTFHGK